MSLHGSQGMGKVVQYYPVNVQLLRWKHELSLETVPVQHGMADHGVMGHSFFPGSFLLFFAIF